MSAESSSPLRPGRYRRRWPWVIVLLVGFVLILNYFQKWVPIPWSQPSPPPPPPPPPVPTVVHAPAAPPPPAVIDVTKAQTLSDPVLVPLMDKRKEDFGLSTSVDAVVSADETIRVGQETVSFQEILAQIEAEARQLAPNVPVPVGPPGRLPPSSHTKVQEESLTGPGSPAPPSGTSVPPAKKPTNFYGVHIVKPGDNLWEIHFAVLREYFGHKGQKVTRTADQPRSGRSTGVARILKYAENMVHIFNVKTRRLEKKLHFLAPNEKIIIFNLTRLDAILGAIKPGDFDRIQFDGRDIYLAGSRPADGKQSRP